MNKLKNLRISSLSPLKGKSDTNLLSLNSEPIVPLRGLGVMAAIN